MRDEIQGVPGELNGNRGQPRPATDLVHHEVEIVDDPVLPEGGLDVVHEWGLQSFPASDPPANW